MARFALLLSMLSVVLAWSSVSGGRGAAAQQEETSWSGCERGSGCTAFQLAAAGGHDSTSAEDGQESDDSEGAPSTAGYWAVGLVFLALAIGFVGVGIWMSRRPPE